MKGFNDLKKFVIITLDYNELVGDCRPWEKADLVYAPKSRIGFITANPELRFLK